MSGEDPKDFSPDPDPGLRKNRIPIKPYFLTSLVRNQKIFLRDPDTGLRKNRIRAFKNRIRPDPDPHHWH